MKQTVLMMIVAVGVFACIAKAEAVAKITSIEGVAQVMKKGSADWRNAKPGMPLEVGDQLYTQEESFAEIRYTIGTVLRLDEKTKVSIEMSSDKTIKSKSAIGNVWVNMRKLVTTGKEFEVSTPTAVAAIRGTVYNLSTTKDSTSDVSVYEGKVAVGPSDELKKKLDANKPKEVQPQERHEVSGPEEIPGPYEVSLDQWRTIVAGQKISVRSDGKFSQDKFKADAVAAEKKFVKKCLDMDKELMKEKVK
jgi:uncharacterized protein YaiE (UPF0345 family)